MEPTKKTNHIIAIAIIAQIVFLVFAIITLKNLLSTDSEVAKIGINNYSSVPNLSAFNLDDTKKSVIEGSLNQIVALNTTGSVSKYNAKIREGSAYSLYVKDIDIHYLNLIIDLDDLKQSYRLIYRYADSYPNPSAPENDPAIFFCLDESELIYGEFNCSDNYPKNIKDRVLYEMVKRKTFSNFTVGLLGDVYKNETLSFHLNTINDDRATLNSAISELSNYLSSLGFNLNDYEYSASSYSCCSLD